MSDMVPEVLNAALDSLFTPKEPGEQEYQGADCCIVGTVILRCSAG